MSNSGVLTCDDTSYLMMENSDLSVSGTLICQCNPGLVPYRGDTTDHACVMEER